jgi:hypothetical protein
MLNGKYGEEGSELTFINHLERSVILCIGARRNTGKIGNFRVGFEIINSRMPITVELASGIEVFRSNTMVYIGQTKKIVIFNGMMKRNSLSN